VPPFLKEYQLLAELAQGGMGSIYLGRRRDEGRAGPCLAIKVLHDRMHDDPSARFMMLDEAHSAARVRHPNVTSVVDVGSYEGGCYLVMEYVEGCSLQQLLQANPEARPPQLLIPIVIDMLEGLHAAHKSRDPSGEPYEIVHRDATPHNVLVGVNGAAKITDFGIAQSKDRYTVTDVGLRRVAWACDLRRAWTGSCCVPCSAMAPRAFTMRVPLPTRSAAWPSGTSSWARLRRWLRGSVARGVPSCASSTARWLPGGISDSCRGAVSRRAFRPCCVSRRSLRARESAPGRTSRPSETRPSSACSPLRSSGGTAPSAFRRCPRRTSASAEPGSQTSPMAARQARGPWLAPTRCVSTCGTQGAAFYEYFAFHRREPCGACGLARQKTGSGVGGVM
jgi:serine/threonine protein kinase